LLRFAFVLLALFPRVLLLLLCDIDSTDSMDSSKSTACPRFGCLLFR
jgi:hypothetical protein